MLIHVIAAKTLLSHAASRSGEPSVGEIHRDSYLAANPRAGNIFASEQAETERYAMSNFVLTSSHGLKLASAQVSAVGVTAVKLASESELAGEIVQQREATGIYMTTSV